MQSQTPRAPMLLFEFAGELFQFEQREPEFAPLPQLPPNSTACLPSLPFAFQSDDPRPHHLPNFCDQYLGRLELVRSKPSNCQKESQPEPQGRQTGVCGINF